jgi:hypothetical protein
MEVQMRFTEVEEERIKNHVEDLKAEGQESGGLDEILRVGQVYKQYGLTPVYIYDDDRDGFIIKIAETRDKKKLH